MLFNAIKGDLRAGVIVTLTEGTQVTHCTEMSGPDRLVGTEAPGAQ